MVDMRIICSRHKTCTSRDVFELIHARINQRARFQRVREYRWVGTHALSMIGTDGDSGLWADFGCLGDPWLKTLKPCDITPFDIFLNDECEAF
jgi:hypothetical protein